MARFYQGGRKWAAEQRDPAIRENQREEAVERGPLVEAVGHDRLAHWNQHSYTERGSGRHRKTAAESRGHLAHWRQQQAVAHLGFVVQQRVEWAHHTGPHRRRKTAAVTRCREARSKQGWLQHQRRPQEVGALGHRTSP